MGIWSRDLYEALKDVDGIKRRREDEEPFTLSSGLTSRVYVDCRTLFASHDAWELATVALRWALDKLPTQDPKLLAGIPLGGALFAVSLARTRPTRLTFVRAAEKSYAMTGSMCGLTDVEGETAVILDDVATTGASIVHTARSLRKAGAIVNDAVVLFEHQDAFNPRAMLFEAGITLHSVLTGDELIAFEGGK